MKKFPINSITVEVEALGGEVTLTEFTQEYRVQCSKDNEFDTPVNGLVNAGLTREQSLILGEGVAKAIYEAVVELTYPNVMAELKRLQESGDYTPPTEEDEEESKKNS